MSSCFIFRMSMWVMELCGESRYDYRYKSPKKELICKILEVLYRKKAGKKLSVVNSTEPELKNIVITKDAAKLLSREDIMRRKAEMAAEAHDSDNEEDKKKAEETSSWLDGCNETVCLDDFDLLKVIGRGSFGKVMQVRKKDSGKVYAMKILKKETIIARNQVEHTRAERAILQSLQHPFLMGLRFAFQTKEKLYFVLDYYQGGELFFHLKHKRRFSEDEARIIVAEIGSALGFLHSMNVIYRDLKPENILLDEVGHACLTDFGLSKDVSQSNMKAQTFCGTPEYLAPEVVMGIAHGKEIDWWSLGILLYELTVGIPPFYSQEVTEMYEKIQHGNLRFPPFLSADCRSLIQGLLVRDPSKRLGYGAPDLQSIKVHPFFASMSWEKLEKKEILPVYMPVVKQGVMDTANFDQQFTSEPVVDSVVQGSKLTDANQEFTGFTFVPKGGALNK